MNIEFLDLSARAYSRLKIRDINTVEQLRNLSDDDLEAIFGRGSLFEEVKERLRNKITNADRIRAMTDEELVLFLDGLTNNCAVCNENCGSNEECPIYKEGHYCRPKDIMDWLRQPVKED